MKICPNCGTNNDENDLFCTKCGTKLLPSDEDENLKSAMKETVGADSSGNTAYESSDAETLQSPQQSQERENDKYPTEADAKKQKKQKLWKILALCGGILLIFALVIIFAFPSKNLGDYGFTQLEEGSELYGAYNGYYRYILDTSSDELLVGVGSETYLYYIFAPSEDYIYCTTYDADTDWEMEFEFTYDLSECTYMTFNGYDMLSYYDQLDSNGQETVQTLQSNAQETIEDLQTEITDYLCESVKNTTIEKFVKLDE